MNESNMEFEQIFQQYFNSIYLYLLSICRNELLAEELTQETFFQVLKSLPTFRGECKLYTWMCQIAKNVWLQYLRKEKKIVKVPIEENILSLQTQSLEDAYILQDEIIQLYQNIRLLDEQMSEVVLMRLSGYLSFRDIGEIFGKSESWARVTYHRARIILKEEKYD